MKGELRDLPEFIPNKSVQSSKKTNLPDQGSKRNYKGSFKEWRGPLFSRSNETPKVMKGDIGGLPESTPIKKVVEETIFKSTVKSVKSEGGKTHHSASNSQQKRQYTGRLFHIPKKDERFSKNEVVDLKSLPESVPLKEPQVENFKSTGSKSVNSENKNTPFQQKRTNVYNLESLHGTKNFPPGDPRFTKKKVKGDIQNLPESVTEPKKTKERTYSV